MHFSTPPESPSVALTEEDVRRLHAEARRMRRDAIRRMTPIERMELAFRLYLLSRENA